MPKLKFRPFFHIPLAFVITALLFAKLADPVYETSLDEAQLQEQLDPMLPMQQSVGPATVTLTDITLNVGQDDILGIEMIARSPDMGENAEVHTKLSTRIDVSNGQIFAKDLNLEDIQFIGSDIKKGTMQYSFLQGISLGAFESMKTDLLSAPVADLNEGNMMQRVAGRIIDDVHFEEGKMMISIAPGRAAGPYFPALIGGLLVVALLAGFTSRKQRRQEN